MEPEINFRLPEFKALGKWLDKHLPFPIAFVLKGWLVGLEDAYIDAKVSSSVDRAINEYRASEPPLVQPPQYHEEESEVEGLPILQVTTPHAIPKKQEH